MIDTGLRETGLSDSSYEMARNGKAARGAASFFARTKGAWELRRLGHGRARRAVT